MQKMNSPQNLFSNHGVLQNQYNFAFSIQFFIRKNKEGFSECDYKENSYFSRSLKILINPGDTRYFR